MESQDNTKLDLLVESNEDKSFTKRVLEEAEGGGKVNVRYERKEKMCCGIDWKLLWMYTGPGWLMSLAYLDPGNLESDLQMGAYSGYKLIWVLWWSTCIGLLLQVLAARLGVVSGMNLAQISRIGYPKCISIALWLMTEIAIIGSDVQEVVGSAIAIRILSNNIIPLWAGALITGADTFTFLFLHACGMRKLEAFICILIATMAACFWVNMGITAPPGDEIMLGIVEPIIPSYGLNIAVGTLGAVIMPHNIYLHSALVQSRKVDNSDSRLVGEANKYFAIEAAVALFVSFLLNLAVVAAYADAFFSPKCANLPNGPYANVGLQVAQELNCSVGSDESSFGCCEIGLADTAYALEDALGQAAKYIWGVGLLAAGQASTMTGTFAGQFVMLGFLKLKVAPWKRLLLTRGIALIPAVIVAILAQKPGASTISDTVDQWLNILQSVQLPFALLPLMYFTSKESVMGKFKNGIFTQIICWILVVVIVGINLYTTAATIIPTNASSSVVPDEAWFYTLVAFAVATYIFFIIRLMTNDLGIWKRCCAGRKETNDELKTSLLS